MSIQKVNLFQVILFFLSFRPSFVNLLSVKLKLRRKEQGTNFLLLLCGGFIPEQKKIKFDFNLILSSIIFIIFRSYSNKFIYLLMIFKILSLSSSQPFSLSLFFCLSVLQYYKGILNGYSLS